MTYPAQNFCSVCGKPTHQTVPPGDHLARAVCSHCDTVHYRNPRIIVGCIPEWEQRILMCRRNIEPRLGKWTFPAGFMEMGETSAEGAARETREESLAEVEIGSLLCVINVPWVSQIYLIHRARMRSPDHGTTPESSETVLMDEAEIPWDEIAFPTVWHALKYFFDDRRAGVEAFHHLDLTEWSRPRSPA